MLRDRFVAFLKWPIFAVLAGASLAGGFGLLYLGVRVVRAAWAP